jgi:hypothetical protein
MPRSIWSNNKPLIRLTQHRWTGFPSVVLLCIAFAFLTVSCKSKKTLVKVNEPEKAINVATHAVVEGINKNQLQFKTFSGKAKSSVAINKDSYDATLNIRIRNGQAIWISITTLLGIEAARVLITPERFKVMNRLNGTFIDRPFNFIYQFASEELSFGNLQSLLVGNILQQALQYPDAAEKNSQGYALNGIVNNLSFNIQTNEAFKTVSNELRVNDGERAVTTTYADFERISEKPIARSIYLTANSEALKLALQLKYNRIALDEAVETPFTIPSKYKEIKEAP